VIGSSVLAEKNDGDRVVEGSIVFDPGENSTLTSGTVVDSDHLGLDDVDGTVLTVGDAYGKELACSMEQDQTSVGGLPGEISDVESVDPPWASTVGEIAFVSQELTCSGTPGIGRNVCPKSGIEERSLIDASVVGQRYFLMKETRGSQRLMTSDAGSHHVFDPGEKAYLTQTNLIEAGSTYIGVGCWTSRLEECCRDLQSGTAILRDGSCYEGGRCCAVERKPVLRLRGGGSVPRRQGRRRTCGGRKIKPPTKRQRLGEVGDSTHEVRAEGLTGTGPNDLVVHLGQRLDRRLSDELEARVDSDDRRILLAGEAQPICGRELGLNSLLCRLNVMAGWVSVSDAVAFDEHIRSTSTRSVTLERPYGYRSLSVYHVLLFKALHPACENHLVNAAKIHAWRLATENGRTAMETLVLHNILRSDAAEKCGRDSREDEYLRMVDPMAVPLPYVLVAFSIGKTDKEKHALQSAE